MSKCSKNNVPCPQCGKESEMLIWESVNTELDPLLKEKVISGELFRFVCPNCGYEAPVSYPFLYHQMEDMIMIHYVDEEEQIEEIVRFYNNEDATTAMLNNLMKDYRKRIVRSHADLKEKIHIFDSGLDDRVIELIKLVTVTKFNEEKPDDIVLDGVYFLPNAEFGSVLFISGNKCAASMEIPRGMYDEMAERSKEKIDSHPSENYVYDVKWAMEIMMS